MINLLKLLFQSKRSRLALDQSFGYGEVNRVADLLKQGDFNTVKSVYNEISNDKRSALINGICLTEKNAPALKQWIIAEPDGAVANLFNGVLWTHTAWLARTGNWASLVTEKQAETFIEHLEQAFEHLKLSLTENEADAETYARMLRVLMGLSEPVEVLYEYYNDMIKFDAEHLWGHLFMLNAISYKWLGSHEEMFEFTKKVVSGINKGSLLHLLVPAAHTEAWLDNDSTNHFQQNHVKQEVLIAYNNVVQSGQLISSQLRPLVHNYFCFAFCQMGDLKLARTERQAFGNYISTYPWAYMGVDTPVDIDRLIK